MALNMKKMRKKHEEAMKRGDFWNVPEGDTLAYIHPPCLPKDKHPLTEGINFIPIDVHYGLGDAKQMGVCLDPNKNEILTHPKVKKALKKRGIKLPKSCPVCDAIEEGRMGSEQAQRSGGRTRYLWGLTPLKFRDKPSGKYQKLTLTPSPAMFGRTVFDGLMDVFDQLDDITDYDSATFVAINRQGRTMTNTKYKVVGDGKTTKNPISIPAKMRKLIDDALKEGGACDLFGIVSSMVKSYDELEALVSGVKVEDEDDDDDLLDDDEDLLEDDDEDEVEDEDEDDDEVEVEDDEDELDDEDDDEEEVEDDDDEDDLDLDDEDDEEEEEEEKPKKKAKKKVAKKKVAKKKAAKKEKPKKKAAKKKKKSDEEDDDDLDLDELDAELDKLSKKKKKKKSKK